jgi:hypothetical protein
VEQIVAPCCAMLRCAARNFHSRVKGLFDFERAAFSGAFTTVSKTDANISIYQ